MVSDADLRELARRLTCECLARSARIDAPLAREVLWRVEEQGQSLADAARSMGIATKDCAYLLWGIRQDIAVALMSALLAGETPEPFGESGAGKTGN